MRYKSIILVIMLTLMTCSAVSGDESMDTIKIKINDEAFDVKLEDNPATQELVKELEKGNITVNATEYGGFEKVGDLGLTLPTTDENVNTI
ncbi:MAG: hypothetical protein E7Z78_07035 [Methanobrevibacter thaueri]|uniref:cyclophilin-like fold protein n=1 Tax=Methanobrevibacter thaueri TaxID=190975 RepID=UPI0026ED5F10|nr:cyclophilin-like fold protein [Methanobrevibacter thaueri]MBE6496185.1 hypothetical protein [Methanobrevibacter thaueri]